MATRPEIEEQIIQDKEGNKIQARAVKVGGKRLLFPGSVGNLYRIYIIFFIQSMSLKILLTFDKTLEWYITLHFCQMIFQGLIGYTKYFRT